MKGKFSVLLSLALVAGGTDFAPAQERSTSSKYTPWQGYNKGVKWQPNLAKAQKKARKENKLLLYYLNTGDINTFETS